MCLASIWQSGWEGGAIQKLDEIKQEDLMKLFQDEEFVKSYTLNQMEDKKVLQPG